MSVPPRRSLPALAFRAVGGNGHPDRGDAGSILREFGLSKDRVQKALQEVRGSQRVTSQNPEEIYQALE